MRLLKESPPRPDLGRPRLPVDRSFSLTGFGTVVTGTLLDGALQIGAEVEIVPGGKRARIRGLQMHGKKSERVHPGAHVAMNLSGIEPGEIRRGQVIVLPGAYAGSRRMDLRVRVLAEAETSLRHNSEVKLYLGTAETMARARILGADAIAPGPRVSRSSFWRRRWLRRPGTGLSCAGRRPARPSGAEQ